MPTLKSLTCCVESGPQNFPLREFDYKYGDGFVGAHLATQPEGGAFSIHLTSDEYVAPGLAAFVFIDGQYQCNKLRRGLVEDGPPERSLVDFRFRDHQQKDIGGRGRFLSRGWSFEDIGKSRSPLQSFTGAHASACRFETRPSFK